MYFFGCLIMSSNDNIFRVTGPFWGEFTGHRWIPLTRANDAELWRFLLSAPDVPSWRCQDWFKILTADIHSSSMNSMSGLHFTVVISMLYGVSFISDRVINETRLYQMHGAIMNTKGPGHIQDMKYTFITTSQNVWVLICCWNIMYYPVQWFPS